jgi:hypothetical protein
MIQKARQKWVWLWFVLTLGGGAGSCPGQAVTVSVNPIADAFLRSAAPASNYGGTGSLAVSGSAAVNDSGQQNGLYDSLVRFSMASVAAGFDASLGTNGWVVTGATLVLNEIAAPGNPMFNRGVGGFELRWISSDTWVEGTGTPTMTTTNGVVYQDLVSVLNPTKDVTLGYFTNAGVDAAQSFALAPAGVLVSNVLARTDLNLYLTAASTSVGFTVNSRNFPTESAWPSLQVTALPKPSARISSVERVGSNQVAIHFNTTSNWTYTVQGVSRLAPPAWSNLFTVATKPFDSQSSYVDTSTNQVRFYRLRVTR